MKKLLSVIFLALFVAGCGGDVAPVKVEDAKVKAPVTKAEEPKKNTTGLIGGGVVELPDGDKSGSILGK